MGNSNKKKKKKKTIKWNVLDYLNVKLLGLYLTFILCIELKYISNVIIYATISNIVDSWTVNLDLGQP